jgi:iron complex outermembrane receptor protein
MGFTQARYWKANTSFNLEWLQGNTSGFVSYSMNSNGFLNNLQVEQTLYDPLSGQVQGYMQQANFRINRMYQHQIRSGMEERLGAHMQAGIVFNGTWTPRSLLGDSWVAIQNSQQQMDSTVTTHSYGRMILQNEGLNLYLHHDAIFGGSLQASLDYQKYDQQAVQTFSVSSVTGGYNSKPADVGTDNPTSINIIAGSADWEKKVKAATFRAGVRSSRVQTDNAITYQTKATAGWDEDYSRSNHFLYLEDNQAVYGAANITHARVSYNVGIRLERTYYRGHQFENPAHGDSLFERSYIQLFPNCAVNLKVDSVRNLRLSYNRRIDRPVFTDLNPFRIIINSYTYASGNPFLQPQLSDQLMVNYSTDHLSMGLEYSRLSHFISQVYHKEDAVTFFTNENIAIGNYWYASLDWTYKHNNFSLTTHSGLTAAFVLGDSKELPAQTRSVFADLNLTGTFQWKKGWTGEFSASYFSQAKEAQFTI